MSSPSLPQFEHEIGARMARGDLAGAAAAAVDCRNAWPTAASGWLLGSMVALLREDREEALELAAEALARDPSSVRALLQRAEALLALGRRAEALAVCATAAANAGTRVPALDAVGQFLVHAGEHRTALEIYDRASAAAPSDADLRAKRAVIHRFLGSFAAAARDFEAVLHMSPDDPGALQGLVELEPQTPGANRLAALDSALTRVPADSKEAAVLHFASAKCHEELGDHAGSWRHLTQGNRLERRRIRYEPGLDQKVIELIIAGFPDLEHPCLDSTGEQPIFIVGLPRTGTTLVERVIASHSAVHAAGELPALSGALMCAAGRIAGIPRDWLGFAAALPRLDAPFVAAEYLARARAWRGARPRFADKQPTNFLYLAPLLRAFPQARIVHLTRHPLGTCHAIYKTRFEAAYPFAYDLKELGDFYIGYRRLMAHWERVLPGRIFHLAYEDLVADYETVTRRLLQYLDLPFDEACLEFHANPAPAVTASAVQVRKPLYDSSVDLWRDYAGPLTALRAQLEAAGIGIEARWVSESA